VGIPTREQPIGVQTQANNMKTSYAARQPSDRITSLAGRYSLLYALRDAVTYPSIPGAEHPLRELHGYLTNVPANLSLGTTRTGTKRESLGLDRNGQTVDTLRSRHDYAPACYLSDFLEGIKQREIAAGFECGDYRAKFEILETGRRNGWFKFHWKTKTWRGSRTPEPSKEDIETRKCPLNLTVIQRKSWDLFGEMPPLRFTHHNDGDACEVVRWTIARARELGQEIDESEAVRLYKAAWKVSQDERKQPIRRDPVTGKVCGRNYYLPEMLRSMPRLERGFPEVAFLVRDRDECGRRTGCGSRGWTEAR
jgi:hypothetical protein